MGKNNGLPEEIFQKVKALLRYPGLGQAPIDFTDTGTQIKSNCYGTSFYIIGAPRQIIHDPRNGWNIPLIFLPGDLPGYICEEVASKAIEKICNSVSEFQLGDLVSFWKNGEINHLGVMVGRELMFHQGAYGGPYRLTRVDHIPSRDVRFHHPVQNPTNNL